MCKIYTDNKTNKAQIVLGSLLGDEGKGITTDYLCKKNPFGTIVVRFSGGHQAGHNVKIGKVSHVHSNLGSGTLRGVPSYFSEHCTFYPVTLENELRVILPAMRESCIVTGKQIGRASCRERVYVLV